MGIPLRVLIVEDSEDDAQLLLRALRLGGHDSTFERVDTPGAMLAALEKQTWDIVIADYVMPRFSGLAALKVLQQRALDLPFIVVSGQIGEDTAVEAMKAGAHDYITKGNLARLVPAVERELREAAIRTERKRAQEALRKAHEELEERVKERTAELARANEELRVEITERKRAEEERDRLLRDIDAERRLFQAVVDNAPAGISVLSGPSFVFELINPAYQAIAPGKTMLGKTVAEVWPELADRVLPLLDHVFRTGETYRATDVPLPVQRVPEAPVEEVYFTFAYVPMRGIEGQGEAILVLVIETTEQVLARNRIEELAAVAQRRAAELRAILDNIVDGVFVCDTQGRITLANEAGVRLLGLGSLEEVRRALADFPALLRERHLDGRPVAADELPLARAMAGQIVTQEDAIFCNPRTQRDVYARTSAAPIRDEQGNIVGAVAVSTDVTELTELDRLKDQFIAVAAHELKTPVTIMKGYAQALLRTSDEIAPPRRRMLEAIDRGANRIDAVVKDLLDISRLHLGRLELVIERIDLPALVTDVADRLALTTMRHRIRVVASEPVVVPGDRDRLEQVLINLLDNAIKYSPKGGDIDVAVAVRDQQAVVSVRDYGVGIATEKRDRLFQRFYSAHSGTPFDYGGMGVGLYISKEIVTRHRGLMWFESEESRGSTFYFSLPLP